MLVVTLVIDDTSNDQIIITLAIFALIVILLNIIKKYIDTYMFAKTASFNTALAFNTREKILKTDFQNLEKVRFKALISRVSDLFWMSGSDSKLTRILKIITHLVINVLSFFMFGTIISLVNPWIAVYLIIASIVSYLVINNIQKLQYKNRDVNTLLDRKMWYIANKSGDFKIGKDIRLYGMRKWMTDLFNNFTQERLKWDRKIAGKYYISDVLDAFVVLVRDGLAYFILIRMVLNDYIGVDHFVLCIGAIASFSGLLSGIIGGVTEINDASLSICDLREFMDYAEVSKQHSSNETVPIAACEISLNGVSYQYEGSDLESLSNIHLTIRPGEKVAIVGLNGAGKSTLIKIICGLYSPTRGSVQINGLDRQLFNNSEYYSIFAVVFQDFHFLPYSIANIVSASDDFDSEKIHLCLKKAGLDEKISTLPHNINTLLNKQVNREGVELSSGELQKLLLARALYKDAPVLILDEPTSALDPISEHKLYLSYNELTKNKTAIFISHRLASTKFCDRIIFMQNGCILETGTHDDLMKKNGEYARIYSIQSNYYTDEGLIDNG